MAPLDNPAPTDRRFRDVSTKRGCRVCGSWRHDDLFCPYRNRDTDTGEGSGNSKGDRMPEGCFYCGSPTPAAFVKSTTKLTLLTYVVSLVIKVYTRTKTPDCQELFTW